MVAANFRWLSLSADLQWQVSEENQPAKVGLWLLGFLFSANMA